MKTKPLFNKLGTGSASYSGMLPSLLMILCVLLILAVGKHSAGNVFWGGRGVYGMGGNGMGGIDAPPVIYPPRQMPMMFGNGMGMGMGMEMSGNGMAWPPDVLRNPYAAPMKDERYLVGPPMVPISPYGTSGAIPINVSTNPGAVDTSYRQVGTLSPNVGWGGRGGSGGECKKCKMGKCDGTGSCANREPEKDGDLLILMGRPLFTNRDTWQYYAISNQRNGVKLPVRVGGKNATNEYGVRELNGGDVITVDGYNKRYQVGMYETDTIKYLPYL